MARPTSTAVAGYYPTPDDVRPLIADRLRAGTSGAFGSPKGDFAYLDPCAGDGSAILSLIDALHGTEPGYDTRISLHSIEMELSRHTSLKESVRTRIKDWRSGDMALHGDAFKVSYTRAKGINLLWLNPPYDLDPQHGRLEEKFLSRFAPTLGPDGILVFLVPYYALKASAATIAKQFSRVVCYRFPDESFDIYKQVVLLASKRAEDLWEPDAALEAQILAWSEDATIIPTLPENGPVDFIVGPNSNHGEPLTDWAVKPVDFKALLACTSAWGTTDRSGKSARISGIMPEGTLEDLLVRQYPLAMPPRSAHIAAGIAAGIFNGARIIPDHTDSKLPALLVKGVFDKEFRTIDEKKDKDGNVKGVIQIQQPRLVTTVLDMSTSTYVTIKPSVDITNSETVAEMTMADLLAVYGQGLMDVMLQQCPVLHDPSRGSDDIELPTLERPLYEAQRHATMAAIKLLGGLNVKASTRKYKSAFVLGEIGSGKTSVALATAEAIKSKRVLVMCPPHLLTSWQDQIRAVVPWFRTVVVSDVAGVQDLAAMDDDVPTIAIVSRETAKLGHAYETVSRCGGCGQKVEEGKDHAKKRERCENRWLIPRGAFGRVMHEMALDLFHVFPMDARIRQIVRRGPLLEASVKWVMTQKRMDAMWERLVQRGNHDRAVDLLVTSESDAALDLIEQFVIADPRKDLVTRTARALYAKGRGDSWSEPRHISLARALLLLLPPADAAECVDELKALDAANPKERSMSYGYSDPWVEWKNRQNHLWVDGQVSYDHLYSTTLKDGVRTLNKREFGDRKVLLDAVLAAAKEAYVWSRVCDEPLYQAIPEPRRFPLATYICRKYPSLFDLLILDEGHEYATDGSAQERSAHRLTSLGIPTLLLTGTVMNGYAESLFTNMWALSGDFRREFDRSDRMRFIDRFGYRKRLVEDKDKDTGKVVEYGSMSDRVERSERMIGEAPGILPLFLLRYLLPLSVTLHKTDLKINIPKCSEAVETVHTTPKLAANFEMLQSVLLRQIKKDKFDPELAGKLWGAMAELPSYLDLATADVGNTDSGRYEIRYPDSCGGQLVASVEPLPASAILPKEQWMLDRVQAALDAGRNVMVFAWHTKLLPRLARLIEAHTGEKTPILIPEKVPTRTREDWINKQVVAKGRRVLVVNPVTIQTGLNNLVYFSDEIWMENPACNPVIYRQAVGRVDRIGQQKTTEIVFPLYADTTQQDLHSLLLQKVAVSMSTDGLDAESALQAAGVGDDSGFSSFAVGRQLFELLSKKRPAFAA